MIFKNTRGNDFFLSEYSPRVYKPAPRPTPPRKLTSRILPPQEMLAPPEKHGIIRVGSDNTDLLKNMDEETRVMLGKVLESNLIKKLIPLGDIEVPTIQEDMYQKIDGFITFKDPELKSQFPNRTSIQIKKRTQSGNDIVFEVKKDFDRDITGRDMKGESVLYIVGQQDGTIGIFLTKYLKQIALTLQEKSQKMLNIFLHKSSEELKELNISHTITDRLKLPVGLLRYMNGAELRVTAGSPEKSYGEGERKLIAFIPFRVGNPIKII